MTQKQALKQLEEYCRLNDMHLTASTFERNVYALAVHKAKRAAREKLNDLWLRVIQHPDRYHNARGTDTEFSYDYMTSSKTSDSFRFYIDKL